MEDNEHGPGSRENLLVLAVILVLLLVIGLFFILRSEFSRNSHVATEFPSNLTEPVIPPTKDTNEPSPTSAIEVSTATATKRPPVSTPVPTFPTPFVGTQGPNGFKVLRWREEYVPCDRNFRYPKVKITGVVISGDAPSYDIKFWQLGQEVITRSWVTSNPLIPTTADSNEFSEQIVAFDEPVEVEKGKHVHVVIIFSSSDGTELTWIDDLFYPLKPYDCPDE